MTKFHGLAPSRGTSRNARCLRNRTTANALADITGTDVLFFFANGASSKLNGNANLDLSGPTTGTYKGLLFFGSRSETNIDHHVNGGSSTKFRGAVYFPTNRITYNGNAGLGSGCTQIIGYTITFIGNSDVELDCTGAGTTDIEAGGSVAIVE